MKAPTFAQFLEAQRDRILSVFVAEVQRQDLSPPGTSVPLLVDEIPKFFDEIIAELSRGGGIPTNRDVTDTSLTARKHGDQRRNIGYDLEAMVREYGILRHCILRHSKELRAQISIDEFDILAKCLSVGVAEAAMEYARSRDREQEKQKADLEFLAEAGRLLSSTLDYRSTLSRLTGLLVPRMADWCAVHFSGSAGDDVSLTHVDPSKVELLRDLYRRAPAQGEAPYSLDRVLRAGEPQLVSHVDSSSTEKWAQNPDDRARLRAIDTRSFIVAPLRVQGTLFGALTLAYSDSGRHYGERELALVSELAIRAAFALDNARLYELSQDERSRVEAATRAKDEFVAMISHELRTPLNAILGWLRLMRGGSLPDSKRQHAFDVIERNAQAQGRLVADLLDISRVITGKIRLNPTRVDLGHVVDMAIEGMQPAADAKRIKVEVEVDRSDVAIRGDGDRLQQVVWNLLTNAVKFTPRNGSIHVRLRRVGSDFELSVEDTGAGIAPTFLPHVFDSFRQADGGAARAHGGLGIGLSIAKHLVELHGGSIDASSAGLGNGATFIVRLPIAPVVAASAHPSSGAIPAPATQERPSDFAPPAGVGAVRVLVVDDEPDARELVAYVLETSGMEVRVAQSSAEAFAELGRYAPHVIISDLGMPDEDGYSLIRRIRMLPDKARRDTPAIALTAFARNEERTRALVEGFNVHMAKPVEPMALVQAVADLAGAASR